MRRIRALIAVMAVVTGIYLIRRGVRKFAEDPE